MRTRFLAPWMATRLHFDPNSQESNSYIYSYEASKSVEGASNWADSTLIVSDEVMGTADWETKKREEWWGPKDERYVMELTLAPHPKGGCIFM